MKMKSIYLLPLFIRLKIVLVGDENVGKSCIISALINDSFPFRCSFADFYLYDLNLEDRKVRLEIWDSKAIQRIRNITNANAVVVVYDVTSEWIKDIRIKQGEEAIIMIVGSKTDLSDKRQVSTDEGEVIAYKERVLFAECSATDKLTILSFFKKISTVLTSKEKREDNEQIDILNNDMKKQNKGNEMESKYNELNSKIESFINEMESKYLELNYKIEKIASEMKKQKLGNEMSSKNDELEFLTNNIIEGSTVFCKLYNNPVVIKKKISQNEIQIELYDNSTDIVNYNDLCFIHFK